MPEETNIQRVTYKEMYAFMEELRKEIREQFEALRSEMRTSYAQEGVCRERHDSAMSYVDSKIDTSVADRERLWKTVRELQDRAKCLEDDMKKLLWWLVGILASVGVSITLAVVTGHLKF